MSQVKHFVSRLVRDEQGQDLIEYALLAGVMAAIVVVAFSQVATALQNFCTNLSKCVGGDSASCGSL